MATDELEDWEKELIASGEARLERIQALRLPDLIYAGLIHPPVTIEAEYTPGGSNSSGKAFHLTAIIQRNGTIKVNDRLCGSVSMAASIAQKLFHATPESHIKHEINGWFFWSVRDPQSGELRKLDTLREECLRSRE